MANVTVKTSYRQDVPYGFSEADCPTCGYTTVLRHVEGPSSQFSLEDLCRHTKAIVKLANGEGITIEFSQD